MFLDSHLMEFTFLSWLDLLGVALAFKISILKIFNLLPNNLRRVTAITSFESKNRSTEGCPKLKSPETRQVQEMLVSTLEHLQVPKWDRTSSPEE